MKLRFTPQIEFKYFLILLKGYNVTMPINWRKFHMFEFK